jgi:hypothetical protein
MFLIKTDRWFLQESHILWLKLILKRRTCCGVNVALYNVGVKLTRIALINVFAQRINYNSTKAIQYTIIR